ncbi:hypothetical protein [Blastomonas sp.]|uniref:hypothetical protein n=1 Tax=Blastomonas sp. TaxID=1909299 RepID=UPI0026365C89|nr:hypothetical protein [Blastomonas sp.]MDM7956608.1 hypothetical protein [Blastomonas sp.]
MVNRCSGLLLLVSCALVGGCSSLSGAQRPVLSPADSVATAQKFKPEISLLRFYADDDSARLDLSAMDYRNLVIALYLDAIDARFAEFRAQAGSESRASGLAFDIALLGLTGAAAVAEADEVNPFATAAAAFLGARASFDKNLFYDRTLPAMFATMEAERARIRTDIIRAMMQDAIAYPLPLAFGDLAAYQRAGSFEFAIAKVVNRAVEAQNANEAILSKALTACSIAEDMAETNEALAAALEDETDPTRRARRLALAAQEFGVPEGATEIDTWRNIGIKLDTDYCRAPDRAAKVSDILTKIQAMEATP